jgi:hypothetical protein
MQIAADHLFQDAEDLVLAALVGAAAGRARYFLPRSHASALGSSEKIFVGMPGRAILK